jgi:hypothetical protein
MLAHSGASVLLLRFIREQVRQGLRTDRAGGAAMVIYTNDARLPSHSAGYNPIRWNCELDGCFNKKKRPKIEIFSDCFPGKIGLTDVDGFVEMNGNFLLLEWKPAAIDLSTGQRLAYERLPSSFAVILVAGDAETMTVSHMAWARNGRVEPWMTSNLYEVQCAIFTWALNHASEWHRWAPTALLNRMYCRVRALARSVGA